MLMGSAIISVFQGMSFLTPTSSGEIRYFVVAFSMVVCFVQSLCIASGHVWNTYIVVSDQAKERERHRIAMVTNKAEGKGKLVELLLSKGMLKIDAMGLADILEGYPDMLIDVLVRGSFHGSSEHLAGMKEGNWELHPGLGQSTHPRPTQLGSTLSSSSSLAEANGMEDEREESPEALYVKTSMQESWKVGLVMTVSFSFFAVLPSLLYLVVATVFSFSTTGIALTTPIVIVLCATIMWCLGVWKSKFLKSSRISSGTESVIVFFVCILLAYGLGSLLFSKLPLAENLFCD